MTHLAIAALEGFGAPATGRDAAGVPPPRVRTGVAAADDAPGAPLDLVAVGHRARALRRGAGRTLDDVASALGVSASALSLLENGRREPRLSTLHRLAAELGVELRHLLDEAPPPTRRAALELALERAGRGPVFAALGIRPVRASRRLPAEALEALVALHEEVARRDRAASATPEEARRANTELRLLMQANDNHLPELEALAEERVRAAGYRSGALTHRAVARMTAEAGFTIVHVDDLPHSTRTVTDLENGRIYLPPASIPGGHGLRSLALQALAHRVLGHEQPTSYAHFLRQRLEINYFAACCLMPRSAAVEHLATAKTARDLAVEDFRDAFGVTHEAAAHRLTNLATAELGIRLHYLRTAEDGALYRGYANDGLPLPADATGAIEGQTVCRHWQARAVFAARSRTTENYAYTDTPAGTYWCSSQTGTGTTSASGPTGAYSITVGVPYAAAKWFRGRDTTARTTSRCPEETCCRRPDPEQATRWRDRSWPSAHLHAHVLAPLPGGTFPGVDDTEVYAFLTAHAGTRRTTGDGLAG
jgi:transcriptional regulator with XRE-family HTH domain